MSEKFDHFPAAWQYWLEIEGRDSNDPDDPGGLTRFGISQARNPACDVAALTPESARAYFRWKYWVTPGFHLIRHKALAIKILIIGGLIGTERTIRMLQEACNVFDAGLVVDGVLGPKTAVWINGFRHPGAIEEALEAHATMYLISLNKKKYVAGWLKRVDA